MISNLVISPRSRFRQVFAISDAFCAFDFHTSSCNNTFASFLRVFRLCCSPSSIVHFNNRILFYVIAIADNFSFSETNELIFQCCISILPSADTPFRFLHTFCCVFVQILRKWFILVTFDRQH